MDTTDKNQTTETEAALPPAAEETMRAILEKIRAYDKIFLVRHARPDGDAVGSSLGLAGILRASFPEKKIFVRNGDRSESLSFLGDEDEPVPDGEWSDALAILLDTATADRAADKRFANAREIVRIDHHVSEKPYGDLVWVEPERSSTCEMIAEFYVTFRNELKMDLAAATCLYTGMVTDSGRFRFTNTSPRTLQLAAELLAFGIETEPLFSRLYLQDFKELTFKNRLSREIRMTENGVAYLFVSRALQKKLGLSDEQASASVSFMESIKGSLIWLAFIENADKTIRVRLRSRFVTVREIAVKYDGGGHDRASGATVHGKKEMRALLRDADERLREYKASNEGWI